MQSAYHMGHSMESTSSTLAYIVNLSMQPGIFPYSLKEAWVKPLLKKITLDLTNKTIIQFPTCNSQEKSSKGQSLMI